MVKTPLMGNGDFRSQECINILKESDIVCTNPPFSLFREYVAKLMEYNKQFLIIGNKNAVSYKEIFPLIKDNKIWMGVTKPKDFFIPAENGEGVVLSKKVNGITIWFTNIPNKKHNEPMVLTATYAEGLNHREDYPKYDNYDAIEVSRCKNIPCDYDGIMGVPITFLDDYCPEQFEILYCSACSSKENYGCGSLYVLGKEKYVRILIKRK
ncbi:MAG: adenine-specific methyltransferase EcoRI family protein [Candidatus Onthovivens sp.]|nr:adenine-specific methyltransferase EcoRI family protein [Candidatus Onthovivens sp.]